MDPQTDEDETVIFDSACNLNMLQKDVKLLGRCLPVISTTLLVLLSTDLPLVLAIGSSSTTPLSFYGRNAFDQHLSWDIPVLGTISVGVGGNLTSDTIVLVKTEAGGAHSESGVAFPVSVDFQNAISVSTLTLSTYIRSSLLGEISATKVLSSVIPLSFGSISRFEWKDIELARKEANIPIVGTVSVAIIATLRLTYGATIQGHASIEGPANLSDSAIETPGTDLQIGFLDTQSVNLGLTEITMTWAPLRLEIVLKAEFLGLPFPVEYPITLMDGSSVLHTEDVELMNFEPDYYALYEKLSRNYSLLSNKTDQLSEEVILLSRELNGTNSLIRLQEESMKKMGATVFVDTMLVIAAVVILFLKPYWSTIRPILVRLRNGYYERYRSEVEQAKAGKTDQGQGLR